MNPHKRLVTVTLTVAEANHIARLLRQRVRKQERQRDHDFVPEPGKRNAADYAIESGLTLLRKFEDALDVDVQVWEDEVIE